MKDKRLQIAIIGLGYWGPNFARTIADNESVNLLYCCDLDKKSLDKIGKRYPNVKLVSDYKEVLQDKTIDGVIVVTPPATHFKIVKDCLLAGKNVLVEKPITLQSSHADELVTIAKKQKKVLMVDHIFQFNTGIRKLQELIQKKKLGKIFYLSASYSALGPVRPDVNSLWDLGPHFIYTLQYILGSRPRWVRAIGESYLKKDTQDVVYITLGFPKHILATIHVSWLYPYKARNLVAVGSKRMAVFDDMSLDQKVRIYEKGAAYDKNHPDFPSILKIVYREGDVTIPRIDAKEPLGEVFRTFIDAIIEGSLNESHGEAGRDVVKILEAAQQSLERDGGKIVLT